MTTLCHRYRPLLFLLLPLAGLMGPVQAAFTDNGDGTVTDTVTGLMWDQCAWGQTWNAGSGPGNRSCTGTASTQNWAASLAVANTANTASHRGYTGWRLPNRTELVSLVNYGAHSPAIDGAAFPNTPSSYFWSSTVYAPNPANAWNVYFSNGYTYAGYQADGSRVRLVRSGQSFGAFDLLNPCCGPGIPLTTGSGALWQMLALPGVPSASPASVAGVFGDGSPSNLPTAQYASAGTGWVIDRREVSTTPSAYVRLGTGDVPAVGTGYWIKSYATPTDGKLVLSGTVTPADVTQAQGCAVAAGCKAITITTVSGSNRYNLVGNPFAYAIDWSKVRVRIDGATTTYTPSQAANVATGAEAANNVNPPVISNVINIWNGTTYDAFSDLAPSKGNLQYFKSFWVNVLPGASGKTIELLIPAEASTLGRAEPAATGRLAAALPWYLGWLDWVAAPAAATPAVSGHVHPQPLPNPEDWYVRLKLDNHVTGWQDHGNLLGQLTGAQPGYDAHDLGKLAPFAKPYLTVMFPHPEWGAKQGDYGTDFRPVDGARSQDWTFEVRADPQGSVVFLSWEGDREILKRSRLLDLQTGKTIKPADPRWARKGYPITLQSPVQRYTWRYLGR